MQKTEAMAALEAQAKELGFSLAELTGRTKTCKSSGPIGAKYRHAENPEVIWSARLVQGSDLEAGKAPETMAV